jgi:hypothetical protein
MDRIMAVIPFHIIEEHHVILRDEHNLSDQSIFDKLCRPNTPIGFFRVTIVVNIT